MIFYAGHHDQARMQGVLEGFKHSPLTPGFFFFSRLLVRDDTPTPCLGNGFTYLLGSI